MTTQKNLEKKEKKLDEKIHQVEKKEEKLEKKAEAIEKKVEEINKITKTQLFKEKAKASAKKFKNEFNKSLNTAVLAAFGFLIALIWRDVITEFVNQISSAAPIQGKLISALITTLICVIGILIITKLLPYEK